MKRRGLLRFYGENPLSDLIGKALAAAFIFVAIGALAGIISDAIGAIYLDSDNDLIEQCEAELPRNQQCELIAVPKEAP